MADVERNENTDSTDERNEEMSQPKVKLNLPKGKSLPGNKVTFSTAPRKRPSK